MKLPAVFVRLFRTKAAVAAMTPANMSGWVSVLKESFSGAWQANITVDSTRDVLAFSGAFSPLTLIVADISKLRARLVEEDADGICTEIKSPLGAVLRRPNRYQNRIQFWAQWIMCKLLHGNTYALKVRDQRGVVVQLYILDPQRVTPLVTDDGDVYYQCAADNLTGLRTQITVPASEIMHDRWNCLFHPLVGIPPLYSCAMSATMGRKIQANSGTFFQNMSRPSGMLTSPNKIDPETALRLKNSWEENFGGDKIGRLAVAGDGLKYEAMTIPAEQAQLIEQLEWSVRDIAAAFHMPLFKVGGPIPPGGSVEAMQIQYYTDCLQTLIESAELCMDEGLGLRDNVYTEFDLVGLARMDTASQVKALSDSVGGGWMAPNEARRSRNLPPVKGGESPMIQQQNYSLAALAKRDALADPFGKTQPDAPAAPVPKPAANDDEMAVEEAAALLERITKGLACDTSN